MKIIKYFVQSIDALWRNKLRSALSTLWIVIWIASVSIMMALWEWLKEKMLENLSVSNDMISILPKYDYWEWSKDPNAPPTPETAYVQVREIFLPETIEKIKKYVGNVKYIIWYGYGYGWGIKFEWKDLYSQTIGVSQDYFRAKNIKIAAGVWFSKRNFSASEKVVILWNDLVKNDFGWKNPIGKQIMIGGYSFTIIGILDKSNDYNVNYALVLPYTTSQTSLWVKTFNNLYVYVDDIQKMYTTKKDVLFLLLKLSGVSTPWEVKFNIESNDEAIKQINETIKQMKMFLWWIAGISLLVGWIWIMNIMLVSVVERTREIWIRKAIWAKKTDIMIQFLVESVVISILWCLIAFWLTLLWVYLINTYAPEDFKAVFNFNVILFASSVSIGMWVIFWLLPAWKAAKMKPIDALRFE